MSGQNLLLLGAVQQAVSDPYYEYTTLLLPGNGTNGAQNNTFLDSSSNAFSITRNGNTTQGTFSPFSQTGWGNYFDGSGDYLSVPSNAALAYGTGDFTVEFWINRTGTVSSLDCGVIDQRNGVNGAYFMCGVDPNQQFFVYLNSAYRVGPSAATTLALGAWYHIAYVRSGTTGTLYINGTSVGSWSDNLNYATNTVLIGRHANGGGDFPGYLSNIRILKGTAQYTANFTPPTAPLTAITNTSLLTCQSNRFIDNSTNALTITPNGGVSVQAFSPFNPTAAWSAATNGGSGYFDGSGDYLAITSGLTNQFDPGSAYTFEGWFYIRDTADEAPFYVGGSTVDWNASTGVLYQFYISSGTIYWQFNSGGAPVSISGTAPAKDQWVHVAVGYNGTTTRFWVNGVSIGTSTSSYTVPTYTAVSIGAQRNGGAAYTGYASNLRFVKGADVYGVSNTTITVPTSLVTAITNTSLLTNFTNAGIYDATSKNDLETVGNAQISTTQSKFGGSSMYFDGTDDSLRFYEIINTQFGTGDFTVECWVYISSLASNQVICDARGSTVGTQPWQFYVNTSGKVVFNYGSNLVGGISVSTATWTHIAAARYGSTLRIFVNGVFDSSATTSASLNGVSGQPAYIGRVYDSPGSPYFNGYIDDLRITKGIARYTSNFTPPTTAFLTL